MSYQHLENTLKAIALTVPAARAFELTVEFALGDGKDTATVGRLEDHFRDRPAMKACIDRMKAEPATCKCIEDRYRHSEQPPTISPERSIRRRFALTAERFGPERRRRLQTDGGAPFLPGGERSRRARGRVRLIARRG